MRIGEVAEAAGTTTRALRYYEQQHLLTARRTATGYRDYDEQAVRRVRNIRELLSIGFTVDDVRTFADLLDRDLPERFAVLDAGTCAEAMRVARERLRVLSERIERLTSLHEQLSARLVSGTGKERP
ncbi:MerR family transcriptional regulator [Planotetraspora sp. A-T 1434]|uniref:MerR family transcriptional regulator n=1 Tax=Planotetraspora sp. A-T 1434 TaxID=2979219 RepID=UPI0021BFED3E|nr:MerR family transcriptional regulator [Planotetraspora sp. A-T 1434]MCT9930616.1 MerR family transcriptional regulator [Planotetraspora sp. A-T 1434]